MTSKEKNIAVYQSALSFLSEIIPDGMTKQDLEKYYVGNKFNYNSLTDIFEQLIASAQNYQGMPNFIKYFERRDRIKAILADFDIARISEMNIETLYLTFRKEFNVTSADTKYNAWHKWSRSVIDAAEFMCNFKSVDDFNRFVKQFDYNLPTRIALPLLISTKISGIGFALACDALKELGFTSYAKPDTHLIDICEELGLSDRNQLNVFEAIVRIANDSAEIDPDVTPNKVDKIMWLISSGNFYIDGKTIGSHKKDYIRRTKVILKLD